MATTYTNVIKTHVLDSLNDIIKGEFTQPVYYDPIFKARGASWFVIRPMSDTLNNLLATGQTRTYTIEIRYYQKHSGEFSKAGAMDKISEIIERLKRLLLNNSSYSPSSTYKYHDGKVLNIDYFPDEEIEGYLGVLVEFECTVTEVK